MRGGLRIHSVVLFVLKSGHCSYALIMRIQYTNDSGQYLPAYYQNCQADGSNNDNGQPTVNHVQSKSPSNGAGEARPVTHTGDASVGSDVYAAHGS